MLNFNSKLNNFFFGKCILSTRLNAQIYLQKYDDNCILIKRIISYERIILTMTIANDECSIFDDILETIGSSGKFQRRFNFTFNFVLVFFASMSYMNVIYSIIIPDHWCKVPGREFTNFTEDEWKNITIPM